MCIFGDRVTCFADLHLKVTTTHRQPYYYMVVVPHVYEEGWKIGVCAHVWCTYLMFVKSFRVYEIEYFDWSARRWYATMLWSRWENSFPENMRKLIDDGDGHGLPTQFHAQLHQINNFRKKIATLLWVFYDMYIMKTQNHSKRIIF